MLFTAAQAMLKWTVTSLLHYVDVLTILYVFHAFAIVRFRFHASRTTCTWNLDLKDRVEMRDRLAYYTFRRTYIHNILPKNLDHNHKPNAKALGNDVVSHFLNIY